MTRRFFLRERRSREKSENVLESKSCPSSKIRENWEWDGKGKRRSWKSTATRKRNFLLFPRAVSACSSLLAPLLVQLYELCSVFPSCRGFSPRVLW